ncbi:hypothetical protein DFH07DRAFT_961369 [Mycena maculata]|uniref:F-box domain-containing protein n=1 Tax=Mycena maculata TaxID=230809 RepID=A0AAD7IU57_9AGAR|nr:hypothetical protein DFH07DRAFT_961369 [Mycena maculata]
MPDAILSIAVFTKKRILSVNTAPRAARPPPSAADASTNPTKRRRRTRGTNNGFLSAALEIPLEVLAEILSWVSPLDLLTLARTSKGFRAHLMSKDNAFLWRASRTLVALPPCPPDLSEPQYAYLAFVPRCHGEGCSKTCQLVIWQFRARYCNDCLRARTVSYGKTVDEVKARAESLEDLFLCVLSRKFRSDVKLYRHAELETFIDQLRRTPEDGIDALVCARRASTAAINEHARMCRSWQTANTSRRGHELYKLYTGRQAAIRARLEELGWGADIERLGWDRIKDGHRALRDSKELTDRIWKNIAPTMIQYIQDCIWEKADSEHYRARREIALQVWTRSRNALLASDPWLILPPALDVVFHPIFLAGIESPPDTTPVDAASFDAAMSRIREVIADWRADAERRLAACILPAGVPVTTLQRARTVATCCVCECSLVYPALLTHTCFTRFYAPKDLRPDERRYAHTYALAKSRRWTCEGFVNASEQHDALAELFRACGVADWDNGVWAAELDARNPLVSCGGCKQGVMDWRAAVNHTTKASHPTEFHWCREPEGMVLDPDAGSRYLCTDNRGHPVRDYLA